MMRSSKTPRPNPYEYAETLGIEVVHDPMLRVNGIWVPDHRMVVLRSGMGAIKDRCTLAHELAHVVLGHEDSSPLHEWQADRYAATHQIARDEFLYWWPKCGTLDDLAFELEVTKKLVVAFVSLVDPAAVPVRYVAA